MVGPLEAGRVGCWGRCRAQARGGGGEQEDQSALFSPSLPQPPLSLCGSLLLPQFLIFSLTGSLHLLRWASGSHSVCQSVGLCSFATAAKGLLHLTAHLQLPGSANRILGLSRGTGRSCSSTMGAKAHPRRAQSSQGWAHLLPSPVPRTPGGPGRLASPVLRKPRGPTR